MIFKENRATLEDLHRASGKAELVGGRIVPHPAIGFRPGEIVCAILILIDDYAKACGRGEALGGKVGYAVPELPSGRESFSPDAAYYDGPTPDDEMDFIHGVPTFAVEIRSKDGYGPAAERKLARKRVDYFMAGTKVVWDVDPKSRCIHVYTAPDTKRTFRRGQIADTEPALPGWRIDVAVVFKR